MVIASAGTADKELVSYQFGEKTVIWLPENNRYLVAEPIIFEILSGIRKGEKMDKIYHSHATSLKLSVSEFKKIFHEIEQAVSSSSENKKMPVYDSNSLHIGTSEEIITHYLRIRGKLFRIDLESVFLEEIVIPKFAHLIEDTLEIPCSHFIVLFRNESYILLVDGEVKGYWPIGNEHYLAGMISLKLTEKIYSNDENSWMGVFHADGISDGNSCILLAGDSGDGKSTAAAILSASGFDVLADDFLPVGSKSGLAYRFPAAISIKKGSVATLKNLFPELNHLVEYKHHLTGKSGRYIPATIGNYPDKVPCIAVVFIQYIRNSGLLIEELTPACAFEKILPDSWIRAETENVTLFLNWFSSLKYFKIRYSDKEEMVKAITELFKEPVIKYENKFS